jgi:hypothetical protein
MIGALPLSFQNNLGYMVCMAFFSWICRRLHQPFLYWGSLTIFDFKPDPKEKPSTSRPDGCLVSDFLLLVSQSN